VGTGFAIGIRTGDDAYPAKVGTGFAIGIRTGDDAYPAKVRAKTAIRICVARGRTAMMRESTVGFEPADELAQNRESVRRRFWIKFKRVVAKLPFAEDLLSAYYCAFDKETPRHVQAALLGAIAYFILPFDFIPDMMPVLGFTDDAAVLATAIRMVAGHIKPEHRDAARAALKRGIETEI
jgi:uncharacterized membrane protein YkvA (DUF1232 family)